MTTPNSIYAPFARHIHWTMAGLITITFTLGLIVDLFPKSWEPAIVETHKAIGIVLIILVLLRVFYRLSHTPPAPTESNDLLRAGASGGHLVLYLLMFIVPVLGMVYAIMRGQSFNFGLFSIGPFMEGNRALARPWRGYHEYAAWALILLALGHAGFAMWHQHVAKDGTLARMWPKANDA